MYIYSDNESKVKWKWKGGKRTDTPWKCGLCDVALCLIPGRNCFSEWHAWKKFNLFIVNIFENTFFPPMLYIYIFFPQSVFSICVYKCVFKKLDCVYIVFIRWWAAIPKLIKRWPLNTFCVRWYIFSLFFTVWSAVYNLFWLEHV